MRCSFRSVESKKDVSSKIRHWCARAERSPAQVRRKLSAWGESASADTLIDALMKEGYLDERRFAEAYAIDHVRLKGWGPLKVLAGLRMEHGIGDSVAEMALAALSDVDVLEAGKRAVRKRRQVRIGEIASETVGALMRRGFPLEVAREAVAAEVAPPKFDPPC